MMGSSVGEVESTAGYETLGSNSSHSPLLTGWVDGFSFVLASVLDSSSYAT